MKKVFSDQSMIRIKLLEGLLKSHDVECYIKNEILTGAIGEIPPIEAWLEIWIRNDADLNKAKQVIKDFQNKSKDEKERPCFNCGESNPSNFELCWKCNSDLILSP